MSVVTTLLPPELASGKVDDVVLTLWSANADLQWHYQVHVFG